MIRPTLTKSQTRLILIAALIEFVFIVAVIAVVILRARSR